MNQPLPPRRPRTWQRASESPAPAPPALAPLTPVCSADAPSRRDTNCRRAAREGLLATLPPAGGEIPLSTTSPQRCAVPRRSPEPFRSGVEVGSSSSPHFAKTSCPARTAQSESEFDESLCKICRGTGLAAGLFGRCTILEASLMHNDALSLSASGALL